MFPAKQRTLLLKLNDRAVLAPAEYFFVRPGKGDTVAAELRIGDQVYGYETQVVAVTDITDLGEQPLLGYMEIEEPPYHQPCLVLQGTLVATADGYKRIEDLRPGDRILSGDDDALDPAPIVAGIDDHDPGESENESGMTTWG